MYPTKKLSEICDIQNGYAFDANLFSEATGFPIIRIRDLKNSTIQTLYKGEIKDNFIVKKGDYLIGMDGEFRCYEWNNSDALLNQRVCRIINYHQAISPKFLFYGINKYLREIEDVTPFVTVKHISSKQIKDIGFPLPPLSTQSKIVAKLDEAFGNIDRQIGLLKANIEDVEQMRKSAMEESFQSGEYEMRKLSEVSIFDNKGIIPKDGEFYNYIGLENIESNTGRLVDFSQTKGSEIKSNKVEFKKGMVLYGKLRPYLNKVLIVDFDGVATTEILPIVCNKDLLNTYLSYFLRNPNFVGLASGNISGARMPRVSPKFLKEEVFIPLPPLPRQHEIVEHLDRVFTQTAELRSSYEAQIRDLETLRQSLLEEAFAGRLVSE